MPELWPGQPDSVGKWRAGSRVVSAREDPLDRPAMLGDDAFGPGQVAGGTGAIDIVHQLLLPPRQRRPAARSAVDDVWPARMIGRSSAKTREHRRNAAHAAGRNANPNSLVTGPTIRLPATAARSGALATGHSGGDRDAAALSDSRRPHRAWPVATRAPAASCRATTPTFPACAATRGPRRLGRCPARPTMCGRAHRRAGRRIVSGRLGDAYRIRRGRSRMPPCGGMGGPSLLGRSVEQPEVEILDSTTVVDAVEGAALREASGEKVTAEIGPHHAEVLVRRHRDGGEPAELLRTAVPSPCHDVPVIRGVDRPAATQESRTGEDEHGDR
jgi:hypothetical protein